MKNILVLCLTLVLVFPVEYVNGVPGDSELVLENVQIEPSVPKKGQLISITGDVYNAGIFETDALASIISVAYFVDNKLLFIDDIDNIEPGISNKIKISSGPIWNAEIGDHVIKIIVDYHNTLRDQYDSHYDNVIEKKISIEFRNSTKIILDTPIQYAVEGENILLTINASIAELDSNKPLNNKKIILSLDKTIIPITTDKDGKAFFSKAIIPSKPIKAEVYFEGDGMYFSSNSSLIIPTIPNNVTSALILKVTDINKQYSFKDQSFEFFIFLNSYDTLFKKIVPNLTQESDSFWLSLPPNHKYIVEGYIDGRIFLVTNEQLKEGEIWIEKLAIPNSAEIKFRVINEVGEPYEDAIVNVWKYSIKTDENGLTDWMKFIPTISNKPYTVQVVLSDQKTTKSESFFVFSEEQKVIDIVIKDISNNLKIPEWVKNNAGWWADDEIDDDSFVQGIQFLIKEGIMIIPSTAQGAGTENKVPQWVKNNAGWWADDLISDKSFVNSIKFLIKENIIKIVEEIERPS